MAISKQELDFFLFLSVLFNTCVRVAENLNTFSAITDGGNEGIEPLYWRIVERERHLQPDMTVNSAIKRHICQSIFRNAFFDKYMQEDAVDVDHIPYDDLKLRVRMEKFRRPNMYRFYRRVLQDYIRWDDGRVTFAYSTMPMPMGRGVIDFVFACMTKDRRFNREYVVYFITDPYNINAISNVPTSGRTYARFVCQPLLQRCHPWLLAEEPATAFGKPLYSTWALEYIYLQIKNPRFLAESPSDDPVCKLRKSEKLRLCASVMNSLYFVNSIVFNPAPYLQSEVCQLNKVSFQAFETPTNAERLVAEWMLPCAVQPIRPDAPHDQYFYYVSRAYLSHYAIVYSRHSVTGGWNIENISGGISVIIEDDEITLATSLVDLLRVLQASVGPSGS